ncbi:hypothetical protein BDN70DRAFT_880647 [Pholiota conissans]|uniref:Uncharacterized protein n=1 Tax=Pholiota conissans TaxID=109636 RepID=A0A9P6CSZ0_9AGAR|nr:hypothetical protein BDN70DRAFT_880647 [Pholiota conissans]
MSTETPSPVSDVSNSTEGTVLREFVDQAIAQKRLATMSPRSAILSHSALQSPTADDPTTAIANNALDSNRHTRKRTAESRRKRGGMEVARPSALSQLIDVDLSRKDPKDEVMRLREILKTVERRSISEAKRAMELEQEKQEAEKRLHLLAETRVAEQRETMKAQQEVRLVQLQLQNAKDEIERKQREMKRIERLKNEAEDEARRERDKARKLYEQTIAAAAREEGRRYGFQAGFDYAQQESRIAAASRKSITTSKARRIAARRPSTVESKSNSPMSEKAKGKQRAREEEEPVEPEDVSYRRPSRSQPQSEMQPQSEAQSRYYPQPPSQISQPQSQQYSQYQPPQPPSQISQPQSQQYPQYKPPQPPSQISQPRSQQYPQYQPPPQAPPSVPYSRPTNTFSHENEMSPSQLPLRNLPPIDSYPERRPSRPPPSQSTSRRQQARSPDYDSEPETHIEKVATSPYKNPPPDQLSVNQQRYPADQPPLNQPPPNRPPPNQEAPSIMKTPAVEEYYIELPPVEQLNREYNLSQESAEIMRHLPRDQWVTASKHHQLRAQPLGPGMRGPVPPQPMPRPPPKSQTPKAVKFPKMSMRPSLAKTKEQASSWYRSLSFRRKNKPVIDPIDEEENSPPAADGPATGSTIYDSQPPTGTEPPESTESQALYSGSQQPPASWYQPKQPSMPPSAPVSARSGYSRMRPISDNASVSTRVSQFDLLSTPHLGQAMSVRSGKEASKKVREKDSLLSVIKENPASRGNTPERYVPGASTSSGYRPSADNMQSMASVLSQPNFGQRPIQQQASIGTFNSSNQNKRRSRRPPPSIEVPDPDQDLEPFGIAYNRGAVANGYQPYQSSLNRRPSRISEKTTPDTSIGIDVVPPSGMIPDAVQSPPHTGVNHLSPHRTYHSAFKQSLQSLRSQEQRSAGRESQPAERPPSAADSSRRQSKPNYNGYADPSKNPYQPRPPSASSRRASQNNPYGTSNPTYSYTAIEQSRSPRHTSQYQTQTRPESVRSFASKKPVAPFAASQTSLNNATGTGSVIGQAKNASSSRLVLATPIRRAASNASMQSQGSYSKFDANTYIDPAYWPVSGLPPVPPPPAVEPQVDDYFSQGIPPRAASANSGLSYV